MGVKYLYIPPTEYIHLFNDNNACVPWSKSKTTKGIQYMTIRENATRESVQNKTVSINHVAGNVNISDIFTKELKDMNNFLSTRNIITYIPPTGYIYST